MEEKEIVAVDTITGRVVASYRSIAECSRETGIGRSTLKSRCRLRQYPRSGRITHRYADDAALSDVWRMSPSLVSAVAYGGRVVGTWQNVHAAADALSYSESYLYRCLKAHKVILYKGVPVTLVRPNRADAGAA